MNETMFELFCNLQLEKQKTTIIDLTLSNYYKIIGSPLKPLILSLISYQKVMHTHFSQQVRISTLYETKFQLTDLLEPPMHFCFNKYTIKHDPNCTVCDGWDRISLKPLILFIKWRKHAFSTPLINIYKDLASTEICCTRAKTEIFMNTWWI
jgi:hypothetical protein